ncbi:DUF4158 domain-containing protein [Emticicia sp. 17c]|uniref:DUF4158 domain-containing protein n=1 Tax=Emticicia sp. 17c TaxID=3127704 RepID=UPI00301BC050
MPITFLTSQERTKYQELPAVLEENVLRQYFHLTKSDLDFLDKYHGYVNRLAIALQIGIVRYFGYLPISWQINVSTQLLNFMGFELKTKFPIEINIEDYGKREKTRTEHLQEIIKHLNFRKWQPLMDEPIFEKWLVEQGMVGVVLIRRTLEKCTFTKLCQIK